MNERIHELARRVVSKHRNDTGSVSLFDEQIEKFAALIVRECAEVCKKQEYDYWRSSEDQDFTPQDCADAIEQHFGVGS